jgi:hypothetical protein
MSTKTTIMLLLLPLLALAPAACGGDDGAAGPPEESPFPPTDTGAVAGQAFEEGDEVVIDLAERGDSGTTGTATLIARGTGQTRVVVDVRSEAGDGRGEGRAQIRLGSCDELGDVGFPIGQADGGRAERLVDIDLESLLAGDFSVAVVSSEEGGDPDDDPGPALACGEIGVGGR